MQECALKKDLLICKGCDFSMQLLEQIHYEGRKGSELLHWFRLLSRKDATIKISIFTAFPSNSAKHGTLIEEHKTVPGVFGEVLPDGNIIGLSGKFSALLLEDSIGDSEKYYLGIHIPNVMTSRFDFSEAHYELQATQNEDNSSWLLAYGNMEIIGHVDARI